jgi:hypothetical protein
MGINTAGSVKDQLNRMNPAAADAKLGDVLNDLITKFNAVLVKLDADAGVTDTNYSSLNKVTDLESRAT